MTFEFHFLAEFFHHFLIDELLAPQFLVSSFRLFDNLFVFDNLLLKVVPIAFLTLCDFYDILLLHNQAQSLLYLPHEILFLHAPSFGTSLTSFDESLASESGKSGITLDLFGEAS